MNGRVVVAGPRARAARPIRRDNPFASLSLDVDDYIDTEGNVQPSPRPRIRPLALHLLHLDPPSEATPETRASAKA